MIEKYLSDSSTMIRKYTAWAIMKLDSTRGNIILKNHLAKETSEEVIEEIKDLLMYFQK